MYLLEMECLEQTLKLVLIMLYIKVHTLIINTKAFYMLTLIPGSSWATKGATKVPTSKKLNHVAGTGSHWDKRMMTAEGDDLVAEIQKIYWRYKMSSRIESIRSYLFTILDSLLKTTDYQINANFLSNDINNYSIDRLPVDDEVENWIIPIKKYREVYELRSRLSYGQDVLENLKNIGFFEDFETRIYSNNKKKRFTSNRWN